MPFTVDSITPQDPYGTGTFTVVVYSVMNNGPDEPPHEDHIQMWGSDGSKPVDLMKSIDAVDAGHIYMSNFDLPPLAPGHYDVSITFPDGSGSGDTIVVQ